MLAFLFVCLFCYFLFLIGSLLLPLFIGLGALILLLYALKAVFDLFTPSSYKNHPYYMSYTRKNPIVWLTRAVWQGFIHILYQLIFTISKAVNDGKNSYKR